MFLIIIMLVALYFTINAIVFLAWTSDGFMTSHKVLETLVLFFFGLPVLILAFIGALIISILRRQI